MNEQIINYSDDIKKQLDEAEQKAWESLSKYKFMMFGYWAAIWVHLNKILVGHRENPFRELVKMAKNRSK